MKNRNKRLVDIIHHYFKVINQANRIINQHILREIKVHPKYMMVPKHKYLAYAFLIFCLRFPNSQRWKVQTNIKRKSGTNRKLSYHLKWFLVILNIRKVMIRFTIHIG